jgi:hypothetical protein
MFGKTGRTVQQELSLIIMHLYWFINCNKCIVSMQDVNNTENSLVELKALGSIPRAKKQSNKNSFTHIRGNNEIC